jgi:hypothetical protein
MEPQTNMITGNSRKLDSDAGDLMRSQKKKPSSDRDKADPLFEKEKDANDRLYNKEIKVN